MYTHRERKSDIDIDNLFIYLPIKKERKTYFEALAHIIVEAGKFKICRANRQPGHSGNS